ncbi:tetratricopeptide repeat protein [Rhizobium sp. BK251]|uniref:ATP-binding protein n=1 Tax=Rhizobium sp. BK251 TaxID=2512125 RepID=UPI0010D2D7A8|nr:tetratricopeptide repeat protein [Rhizobium sp. BK251]TCL68086.1 putative ATPase [Rhizobium sp. BK251]
MVGYQSNDKVQAADDPSAKGKARAEVAGPVLQFGAFTLLPHRRVLTKDGEAIEIGGRALDLLIELVTNAGQTVDKERLISCAWPDIFVESVNLRVQIVNLRKVLGDGPNDQRYIKTHVGRGYRFVAPVKHTSAQSFEPVSMPEISEAPKEAMVLPAEPARMVGRGEEVRLLVERLLSERFITILGPGGVGKTTVAVAATHLLLPAFEGAAYFADLGALRDAHLVPSFLASLFDIPVQSDDPTPGLIAHLGDRQLLLVLDNCEHVVDAVAKIAELIFFKAPRVHILATSREALRVEGEHIVFLEPLGYPSSEDELQADAFEFPAIQLFVNRAEAAGAPIERTPENAELITSICARLDGMALAIELTAGAVAAYGVAQTAALLRDRMQLSWIGRRTAAPRHRTIEATLDWSYALLSPMEQTVMDRLGIFVGSFTLPMALAVLMETGLTKRELLESIHGLKSKSLIGTDGNHGGPSFRLLELTRDYAHTRLRKQNLLAPTARAHAAHMREMLSDRRQILNLPTDTLRGWVGNLRAALQWAYDANEDAALRVSLAAGATTLLLRLSLFTECRKWCEAALKLEEAMEPGFEMELQGALGLSLMFTQGQGVAAGLALERAHEVAESLGSLDDQLRFIGRLHIYHERQGDFLGALNWGQRSRAIAQQIGTDAARGTALSLLGISHHLMGDQAVAREEFEESIRYIPPSDLGSITYYGFDHRNRSQIGLARTMWLLGFPAQARAIAVSTVAEAAQLGHPLTHCIALIWAVSVFQWVGDLDRLQESVAVFRRLAMINALGPYLAVSQGMEGELAIREGRIEEGVRALEACLERLHAVRYELLTTTFNMTLAEGLVAAGRLASALDLVEATIDLNSHHGDVFAMPELLRIKAAILIAAGDRQRGVAVQRESLDWSRQQGTRSWELRTAIDLGEVLIEDDRSEEALELLGQALEPFIEGRETHDVQRALQLVEQISDTRPPEGE